MRIAALALTGFVLAGAASLPAHSGRGQSADRPIGGAQNGAMPTGHRQADLSSSTGKEGANIMQNGLKRIVFRRSGGSFFMVLSGTVNFDVAPPAVTSDAGPDARALSPAETEMFGHLDIARLRARAPAEQPVGGADSYQYDVELEFVNDKPLALKFHDRSSPAPDLDGIADLASWVRQETASIWKQKTAPRP